MKITEKSKKENIADAMQHVIAKAGAKGGNEKQTPKTAADFKAAVWRVIRQRSTPLRRADLINRLVAQGWKEESVKWHLKKYSDPRVTKQHNNGAFYSKASLGDQGAGTDALAKPTEEAHFYPSFAEFLERDEDRINECTKATKLGGNSFAPKSKWSTPDVIGAFNPKRPPSVKSAPEIVSAEIKIASDDSTLVTGFSQACSYLLFSHRVYLVVPRPKNEEKRRIESLCRILGIGLVYFNPKSAQATASIYQMVLRARTHAPDTYYVDQYIHGDLADKILEKD